MRFHPLLYVQAKAHVRQALRANGATFLESLRHGDEVTHDVVDHAATDPTVTVPDELKTSSGLVSTGAVAAGAGGILAAILAFFASAQGQALITAILKLLGLSL